MLSLGIFLKIQLATTSEDMASPLGSRIQSSTPLNHPRGDRSTIIRAWSLPQRIIPGTFFGRHTRVLFIRRVHLAHHILEIHPVLLTKGFHHPSSVQKFEQTSSDKGFVPQNYIQAIRLRIYTQYPYTKPSG